MFSWLAKLRHDARFGVRHTEKRDGLDETPPAMPVAEADSAVDSTGICPTGSPVVIATGEKLLPQTDASSAGLYGMTLDRTYRSVNATGRLFGANWTSSVDPYRVTKSTAACINTEVGCIPPDATVTFPDGAKYKYTWMPTSPGEYQVKGNAALGTLAGGITPTSGWSLGIGTRSYVFNSTGRQLSASDSAGDAWTQIYVGTTLTKVTNRVGKSFNFTWTAGRVSQVIDPAGNAWDYSYNANGMLTSVTSPGPSPDARTYHYENADPTLLTGVSIRVSTYRRAQKTGTTSRLSRTTSYTGGTSYVPTGSARGSTLESSILQRRAALLCCQGLNASTFNPWTAPKCLTLAVISVAWCSMAVAPMSASARRSPCDSARLSMRSAARWLMAGVIGTISVLRAARPFFSRASSALSRQPWASSM